MELLELAKKLRRDVKKAGMELEKQMKPINTELRVRRGAVTGGVKEKRVVNENGLNDFLDVVNATTLYNVSEVITVEKDLLTVVLTPTQECVKTKVELSFAVAMRKGKILLETITFTDSKTEEVVNATLKDIKNSLKTVKVEE